MRRRDDADVDGDVAMSANQAHDALFEDAEQLGLRGEGQVPDFVEEQRAAPARDTKGPARFSIAPVNRALDMTNSSASIRFSEARGTD